jgi:hypothetical protein
MRFMNDISQNSLLLPEGVKSDFENTKRPFDVKAIQWNEAAEVRDQVFPSAGISASRNTSSIIATLGSDAYCEGSGQYWVARFESGNTSCEAISRPGRPLTDLSEPFRLFLHEYPFSSARMRSRHFSVCVCVCVCVCATTVKDSLPAILA